MEIEYRCTNELSLFATTTAEDNPVFVRYCLHNRLFTQAHTSSYLSERELLASICLQISTLQTIVKDKKSVKEILQEISITIAKADQ